MKKVWAASFPLAKLANFVRESSKKREGRATGEVTGIRRQAYISYLGVFKTTANKTSTNYCEWLQNETLACTDF